MQVPRGSKGQGAKLALAIVGGILYFTLIARFLEPLWPLLDKLKKRPVPKQA